MKTRTTYSRRHQPRQSALAVQDLGFQLAPFVDVIFVILLFYLVKTAAGRKEGELLARLPMVEPGTPPPGLAATVESLRVEEGGGLEHNGDVISGTELTQRMSRLREQSRATATPLLVSVSCDEAATYDDLAQSVGALNRAGVFQITLEFPAADAP